MKPWWQRRIAVACLATLLLTSPLLAGCVQVQVTDEGRDAATPTPYTELAFPREARDLAILGIEFNPPLRYEEMASLGRLALVVAVENRGQSVESDVMVEARLAGTGEADVLMRRSEQLESIAPGEVRLVKFEGLSPVPYRSAYSMTITVSTAPGETHTIDNQRTYRLSVTLPGVTPSPLQTSP